MAPSVSQARPGLDELHLLCWHAGIFGVPAVELPPHAAHRGRDDIALAKLASWRLFHKTDRFDAQDARELDAGRMALPGKQF
jgi:hypothetical protein